MVVARLATLLLGAWYYVKPPPKGNPYTELTRVVVAAVRKARVGVTGQVEYYVADGTVVADSGSDGAPTKRLGFLNRAAMITSNDSAPDTPGGGHGSSKWRLCTVQQVEDLKSLLGILPLWSSGIFLSVSIDVMIGMVVLQTLAMDRSVGPRFKIPAGSITVSSLAAFIAATPVLERVVFPLRHRVQGAQPTPLQRVGLGHVVNVAGMVAAALVERHCLGVVRAHHGTDEALGWVTPMTVLWVLIPQGLVGVDKALHFPRNTTFYYQEFPQTLRSTATAMTLLIIAMRFYLSTVFMDVVRRVTSWLPGNINQGRLDNVYWAVAVAATVNFGYFLICARLYKSCK